MRKLESEQLAPLSLIDVTSQWPVKRMDEKVMVTVPALGALDVPSLTWNLKVSLPGPTLDGVYVNAPVDVSTLSSVPLVGGVTIENVSGSPFGSVACIALVTGSPISVTT